MTVLRACVVVPAAKRKERSFGSWARNVSFVRSSGLAVTNKIAGISAEPHPLKAPPPPVDQFSSDKPSRCLPFSQTSRLMYGIALNWGTEITCETAVLPAGISSWV